MLPGSYPRRIRLTIRWFTSFFILIHIVQELRSSRPSPQHYSPALNALRLPWRCSRCSHLSFIYISCRVFWFRIPYSPLPLGSGSFFRTTPFILFPYNGSRCFHVSHVNIPLIPPSLALLSSVNRKHIRFIHL